uniref:AIG1-type G domain-containing protein n=1 Tax=Chelonoidis abingdonii TaxID=106734 RepID=A0A8C0H408_CHEAB
MLLLTTHPLQQPHACCVRLLPSPPLHSRINLGRIEPGTPERADSSASQSISLDPPFHPQISTGLLPTGLGAQESSHIKLKFILVGKAGAGKSATGNTILGNKVFESKLGAKPVTKTCSTGSMIWNGKEVVVIDTPDVFSPEASDTETCREISRCIALSAPGPHALVLVTQLGRYTAEDKEAVKRVWEIFGVEAKRNMIVLFTRKEDLGGNSLTDYVRNSHNKNLKELIQECKNRYCTFNNKATGAERNKQVNELMEITERMLKENGGRCYTNELEPFGFPMLDSKTYFNHCA